MNYLQILALSAQVGAIAAEQKGGIPKGDAGLYLVGRTLCERLEARNPGIAFRAGFSDEIAELRHLAHRNPPPTLGELDTELLNHD